VGKYRDGWEQLRKQRHRKQVAMGLIDPKWKLPGRDREVVPWEEAEHKPWQDLRMAVYAAMIDSMDQGIGRILRALDVKQLADNTVVMFLSDNGGCAERPGGDDPHRIPGPKEYYTHCGPGWAWAQNTPFRRYKQYCHEGGISTPFIVRWPGVVKPNSLTNEVGHIIDLLATCVEVAGAEYPDTFEGHRILPTEGLSLVPILKEGKRAPHDRLFWEWNGSRAVREGDWKLSWDRGVKRWELYNLVADRTETDDLSGSDPEKVKEMSAAWRRWAEETGVTIK
jgi:arylsulfatase